MQIKIAKHPNTTPVIPYGFCLSSVMVLLTKVFTFLHQLKKIRLNRLMIACQILAWKTSLNSYNISEKDFGVDES